MDADDSYSNKWNQLSVLSLIKLWKFKDCLYNPQNRHYHNKRERAAALESIAKRLQDLIPNVTPLEIKTKINYLRSQYARELLKIHHSQIDGDGTGIVHVPTAYWFEQLRFLKPFVRKTKSNYLYPEDDTTVSEIDDPLQSSRSRSMYDESSFSEMDEPTPSKIVKKEKERNIEMVYESDNSIATSSRIQNVDHKRYVAYDAHNNLTTSSQKTKPEQTILKYDREDNVLMVDKDYVLKLSVMEKPATAELEFENSITNFFRTNIREVKDKSLQDDLMSKIMLLIYEYKRKQRELDSK